MRKSVSIAVVCLVFLAGCSLGGGSMTPTGTTDNAATPATSTSSSSTNNDESMNHSWKGVGYSVGNTDPPAPPSNLSNETVRRVAAEALQAHLHNQLSNLSGAREYGTSSPTIDPEAKIIDRGDDFVLVRVRIGYSWECGASIADLSSTAKYRINYDNITRVSGGSIRTIPDCRTQHTTSR